MQQRTTTREYIPTRSLPSRSTTRGNRPVAAPQRAAATLPIITREKLGRPGFVLHPVRNPGLIIALAPPSPEVMGMVAAKATAQTTQLGVFTTSAQTPTPQTSAPAMGFATPANRKKMALLLPGHNEELIIATTIRSAIKAGQDIEDIYVVDDASTDNMHSLAVAELGTDQVLQVERSGKAMAVQKAIKHFELAARYEWVHVADADSVFSPNYFVEYKQKLTKGDYAVALGFVQSMRGNWISTYRALTYTYSQHVTRRIQSKLGMISVFPGPITAFKTDILPHLDFAAETLTEDFDITLQVHRKKLGHIAFIPSAVNYTQDPQSLKDFWRQNLRWQRGFFQGVKKYKIGLKRQLIDLSLGWQMAQSFFFLIQMFVILPLIIAATGSWMIIPVMIAADIIINGITAIGSSALAKRWNLLGALPYFYFLRWLEIAAYFTAFFEIMILKKFQSDIKGWGTEGRRYKISTAALADIAA